MLRLCIGVSYGDLVISTTCLWSIGWHGFWFNLSNTYVGKKSVSFQQLPGTLGLLIVTAVSGRAQKTSAKSDEALFFSYWTKVLPGAPAQGKVNQVTVGVTGVSIISVTKCCFCQMLFWLRISWALWPFCCFPGHFF